MVDKFEALARALSRVDEVKKTRAIWAWRLSIGTIAE